MTRIPTFASPQATTTQLTMLSTLSDIKVFAVVASVLYMKFLVSTMIQGRKAFAANTRLPEDKTLVYNIGINVSMDAKVVKSAVEDEIRWKRIIQNDLESMPLAFVVFWSAIAVGMTPCLTKTLMTVYSVARIGHTIAYSKVMPRARLVCWMVGSLCIIAAALNCITIALLPGDNIERSALQVGIFE